MASESARARLGQIEADNMKAAFATEDSVCTLYQVSEEGQKRPYELPDSLAQRVEVMCFASDDGTRCFGLAPKGAAHSDTNIIYYHGGGFVMQIGEPHWSFAIAFAEALSCTVTVPIYPLAPTYTHEDTYRSLISSYKSVLVQDPKVLVVAGDSAGGNLALAAGQLALQQGLRQPDLIIVLSPLVDAAGELDGKDEIDRFDPMISTFGTERIMRDWAGDAVSRRVFPPCILQGPFEGLAPVLCFVGSREVLLPDSLELAKRIAQAGGSVDLEVRGGMWHTYPLMPETDEGKMAFERIVAAVRTAQATREGGVLPPCPSDGGSE